MSDATTHDESSVIQQASLSNSPVWISDTDDPKQVKIIGNFRVEVVRSLCISAASCVAIAPKTYDLDEEGIAVLLDNKEFDDAETILLGAQSCPTAAIIITDITTGQQVWPRV